MKIIPAIDIINGKCVRLTKGDYSTKIIYNDNPLEVAKKFEANGISHLHLVDLDGAKANRVINYKIINDVAKNTKLKIDFGGGIKCINDLNLAFENGADQITIGSMAVKQPDIFLEWLKKFGNEKIILGADCIDKKIAYSGWQFVSDYKVVDFIKNYEKAGVRYVVCTDISKDGTLQGPSLKLYEEIISETNVSLIASGGVSDIGDLIKLKKAGCEAAIVGKAIYEGKITLNQIQEYYA